MRAVDHIELQLESRDAVAEFGLLSGEDGRVDFLVDSHIDDAILLLDSECDLALDFGSLSQRIGLSVFGLGLQNFTHPVADLGVFDPHLVKDGQDLAIDIGFGDAGPGVSLDVVVGAAVVDVLAFAVLGPFRFLLARDGVAAMTTSDAFPGIGHFMGLVDVPTQQSLHAVPGGSVSQWFVLAGIPLASELQFTDVGPVPQHQGQRCPMKLRIARLVRVAFPGELVGQRFERVPTAGVQLEGPHHSLRVLRMRPNRFVAESHGESATNSRDPSVPVSRYFRQPLIPRGPLHFHWGCGHTALIEHY